MKITQLTELFANIKSSFVSFFAILMFVALGVGVFTGINWSAPALQTAADKVFDECNFHDFSISFNHGFTEDDVDELLALDGVDEVALSRVSYENYSTDEASYPFEVVSFGDTIDKLKVVEGELPTQANEIAVKKSVADELGLTVGSTITFDPNASDDSNSSSDDSADSDGMTYLTTDTFTVTALVDSPEFIATTASSLGISPTTDTDLDAVGWVIDEAFNVDAFQGAYPVLTIVSNSLRGLDPFSDEYSQRSAELKDILAEKGQVMSQARFEDLKNEAQSQVDEGRETVADGWKQVSDGEVQIAKAKKQIESSKATVSKKESELAQARFALKDVEAVLAQLKSLASKGDYSSMLSVLKEMLNSVSNSQERQQLQNQIAAFEAALQNDPSQALAIAQAQIPVLNSQIQSMRGQIAQGEKKIAQAKAQITSGQNEIAKNTAQLEETRSELKEKEQELNEAQQRVDEMEPSEWTISPREYNAGVVMVDTLGTTTNNLSYSMALLFVIVGLLVTYTTVSRIAHEQIVQIGTKKALGLRSREITLSFMLYTVLAVVAGVVVGIFGAIFVVESVVSNAIGIDFIMGNYPPYFSAELIIVAAVVELVLILFSAWFACRGILREHAVDLLQGEKPPAGKTRFYERFKLWQRLPLYTQTIINNCLNDKRRVFSTIVGVAGITALVVTALTLSNDIENSFARHYDEIYSYDTTVTFDPDEEGSADAVKAVLEDNGLESAAVYRTTTTSEFADGKMSTVKLVVPTSPEDFANLYTLVSTASSGAIDELPSQSTTDLLSLDGAWVSQSYQESQGAKIGDTIKVFDNKGDAYGVPIVGFFDYYLPHVEVVLSEASYENIYGEAAQANTYLTMLGDDFDQSNLRMQLKEVDGFLNVVDEKTQQYDIYGTFTGATHAVVFIYLLLSILMSIVVLLNLNVMFIEEKKRELIVLMINGFSVHDAKRYIYNDTILLTIIGIIVGLILGTILGGVSVQAIQSSTMHFYSGLDWAAIGVGTGVSAVLAAIMSLIALRRIPRFSLTDINKI